MRGLHTHIGARIPHVGGGPTPPVSPVVFTAESLNQADRVALGLPLDGAAPVARDDFLASVANPGYLTFESATVSGVYATTPLGPFAFDAPKAAFSASFTTSLPSGLQRTLELASSADNDLGRFNTTPSGVRIYEFNDNCTITLSASTYCFGFYATDVGDFDGQSKITITDTVGSTTYTIPNSGITAADGNLIFWGIINNHPILSATLFNVVSSGAADVVGLDDIVVADLL